MNKLRLLMITVLLVSMLDSSFAYTSTRYQEKFDEVYDRYRDDIEFNRMVEHLGIEKALGMIHDIAKEELTKNTISARYGPDFAGVDMPLIRQKNSIYCGPATVLQSLHAMDLEDEVSGTTNDAKQSSLGREMNTDNDNCTYVWRMQRQLNKYLDSNKYKFTKGTDLSLDEFENLIKSSLSITRPPIFHARTEDISYYEGKEGGHYISISYYEYDYRTGEKIMTLVDPNWRDEYRGVHDITPQDAFNSITLYSDGDRYAISD